MVLRPRSLPGLILAICLVPGTPAAPSPVPGILKTLETLLPPADLPQAEPAGVRALQGAVAAADALLRTLDPHGFSAAALEGPRARTTSAETGLLLGRIDGYPSVAGSIPYSPAAATHLGEGDRILEVDGAVIRADESLASIAARIESGEKPEVELKVLHPRDLGTSRLTLTREEIRPRVLVRNLPESMLYVQVTGATSLVLAEYTLRLGKLRSEKLAGVVLDLRGCRGGGLDEAVVLANPFLADRPVGTETAGTGPARTLRTSKDVVTSAPLVVLVGSGTTGAAEIAARSLQVNHRGLLLGGSTLGIAPEYRTLERSGAHLRLPARTVAAAEGDPITGRGFAPDLPIRAGSLPKGVAKTFSDQLLAFAEGRKWEPPKQQSATEKDLKSALGEGSEEEEPEEDADPAQRPPKNPDQKVDPTSDPMGPVDPFHDYPMVKRHDPRLVRAVHLLKAATIFFRQAKTND